MDRRMEQAFKADQSYVHMHGHDQPCHVYACACFCVRACIDVNVCMLLFIHKTCLKVRSWFVHYKIPRPNQIMISADSIQHELKTDEIQYKNMVI